MALITSGWACEQGHRLAVPVLYADLNDATDQPMAVPLRKTIFAFARLHHHIELGEADGTQHGLSPDMMALITSDCGKMRSPSIKWP